MVKEALELSPYELQKCHELYSMLVVRQGVILLGPTGSGKTTVVHLLKSALNSCHSDYYGSEIFHYEPEDESSKLKESFAQVG